MRDPTVEELDWVTAFHRWKAEHGNPTFEEKWLRTARRQRAKGLLPNRVLQTVDNLTRRMACHRLGTKPRILFASGQLLNLALTADHGVDSALLASGSRAIRLFVRGFPFASPLALRRCMLDAVLATDPDRRREYVLGGVNEAIRLYDALGIEAIVVNTDSLPLERMLLLAARARGVRTVCIQHGIFLPTTHEAADSDGYDSDAMLLWGDFFTQFYQPSSGANPVVFGYPFEHKTAVRSMRNNDPPIACFAGQNWESYDHALEGPKFEILLQASQAVRQAGWTMVYRPHPSEGPAAIKRASRIAELAPKGQKLRDAFERYDAFLGITSTVLVEAALAGREAVQLRHPAFEFGDLESYGACASCASDDVHCLADRLRHASMRQGSAGAFPAPSFIRRIPDPGKAFSRWMLSFLGDDDGG